MTTRARFEKWAEAQGWNVERCDTGEYRTMSTDAAWGGWLACSDEAEVRHSIACAEWSSICRSGRRHGAAVGANECANLLRGWRKNNEPPPLEPVAVRFNATSHRGAACGASGGLPGYAGDNNGERK